MSLIESYRKIKIITKQQVDGKMLGYRTGGKPHEYQRETQPRNSMTGDLKHTKNPNRINNVTALI